MQRTSLHLTPLAALIALPAFASAQHVVLTSPSSAEVTLGVDPPEIDAIRTAEVYEVIPLPGTPYTARPFLPTALQYAYVGDLDADGQYVEDSTDGPGGELDALLVKNGTPSPVTPRDVYFSIASTTSINIPGLTTSDVVRFAGQGVLDTFLSNTVLAGATGGTSLNLDALAQSPAGDLFLSFADAETLHFGSAADGDLIMIPASAITYDASGNVQSITAASAVLVATEAELIAMVNASGFRTSVGGTVTTTFELSGLEMDPNGGTWTSTQTSQQLPNVLFCWADSTNDGAIISTANGGSFAVINGVPMASAVATQGDQIGWQPDTTGTFGPGGLAIVPMQPTAFAAQHWPRNLHTQGTGQTVLQVEVSGGTPGGFTAIAISVGPSVPGGSFPVVPSPLPASSGELFLSMPLTIGLFPNDTLGNTRSPLLVLPTTTLSGLNAVTQALDLATLRLSTPAAMSFL